MSLIDTEGLKVFWNAIKNFRGEVECTSKKAKQDVNGNDINKYYIPINNVKNKGSIYKPVYFDEFGVAHEIANFDSETRVAEKVTLEDIGKTNQPVHVEKGVVKPISFSNDDEQIVKYSNGELVNSNKDIGANDNPIYIKNGKITPTSMFPAETILKLVYPVGAIFISTSPITPAIFLGGEWKEIRGRFLLGVGVNEGNNTNAYGACGAGGINRGVKEMGGEIYHTLSQAEMPYHKHDVSVTIHNAGEHTHTAYGGIDDDHAGNFAFGFDNYWANNLSYAGNHSHGTTVGENYKGANYAHNNIPPYYTVYMWERTK